MKYRKNGTQMRLARAAVALKSLAALALVSSSPAYASDFAFVYSEGRFPLRYTDQRLEGLNLRLEHFLASDPEMRAALDAYLRDQTLPGLAQLADLAFQDRHGPGYERRLKAIEAALFRADFAGNDQHAAILTELVYFLQNRWTILNADYLLDPTQDERTRRVRNTLYGMAGFLTLTLAANKGIETQWLNRASSNIVRINQYVGPAARKTVTMAFRKVLQPIDFILHINTLGRLGRAGAYTLFMDQERRRAVSNNFIRPRRAAGKTEQPFPSPLSIISLDATTPRDHQVVSRVDFADLRDSIVNPLSIVASIVADRLGKRAVWGAMNAYFLDQVRLKVAANAYHSWRSAIPGMLARLPTKEQAIRAPFSVTGMALGAAAGIGGATAARSLTDAWYVRHMNKRVRSSLDDLASEVHALSDDAGILRAAFRAVVAVSERARWSQSPIANEYEAVVQEYSRENVCSAYSYLTKRLAARAASGLEPGLSTVPGDPDQLQLERQKRSLQKLTRKVGALASQGNREIPEPLAFVNELISSMTLAMNDEAINRRPDFFENLSTLYYMAVNLRSTLEQMIVPNYVDPNQYQETAFTILRVSEALTALTRVREAGVAPLASIPDNLTSEQDPDGTLADSANYYIWQAAFGCRTPYTRFDVVH